MLKTAASSVAEATPSAAPASVARAIESSCPSRGVVWIDLDNSPHVPFFVPIIHQLEARGYSVLLTARDCFQVAELAKLHNLKCETIGRHYGKNSLLKIWGLFVRAAQLLPIALRHRPALAVSHGSRGQLLISWLLRIPTLQMGDYEFAKGWVLINPTWEMKPDIIPALAGRSKPGRVLLYPGIKEDVYVPDFCPDPTLRSQLGLSESDVVVTVRPPASEAHYHDQRSDELFRAVMDYLAGQPEVRIVVLPRNDRQATAIRQMWPAIFATRKAIIPEQVVDGLNLIWYSDLVISGGGTMNREAAALGVPVYSTFRGKIGAVDHYLVDQGRLVLLETADDLYTRLRLQRRSRPERPRSGEHTTLNAVTNNIIYLAELESQK